MASGDKTRFMTENDFDPVGFEVVDNKLKVRDTYTTGMTSRVDALESSIGYEYLGIFDPSANAGNYDIGLPESGGHKIRFVQTDDPASADNDWSYIYYVAPDNTERNVWASFEHWRGSAGTALDSARKHTFSRMNVTGATLQISLQMYEQTNYVGWTCELRVIDRGTSNCKIWELFSIEDGFGTASDYRIYGRRVL